MILALTSIIWFCYFDVSPLATAVNTPTEHVSEGPRQNNDASQIIPLATPFIVPVITAIAGLIGGYILGYQNHANAFKRDEADRKAAAAKERADRIRYFSSTIEGWEESIVHKDPAYIDAVWSTYIDRCEKVREESAKVRSDVVTTQVFDALTDKALNTQYGVVVSKGANCRDPILNPIRELVRFARSESSWKEQKICQANQTKKPQRHSKNSVS